ncbi:hypothetical protein EV363DRAFT_1399284 [Boletus edulis]|nr:hypothetical protein EV363DRAFT_1399284 [Boletus edulis]
MTLPCIAFQLPPLSASRTGSGRVYHVDTHAFGRVEIQTRYNLSRANSLHLIHPWLDTFLEHEKSAFVEDDQENLWRGHTRREVTRIHRRYLLFE